MRGYFGIFSQDETLLKESWDRHLNSRADLMELSDPRDLIQPGLCMAEFFPLSDELKRTQAMPEPEKSAQCIREGFGRSDADEAFPFVGWFRLDNMDELCSSLQLPPATDEPELIIRAYQTWGPQCVERFIGDFSFVIWDPVRQQLFMAKDQLGIRPLFYYQQDGLFIFATTIALIKSAFDHVPALNEHYIARELRNYPPSVEETFFREIHRLSPAHYLILGRDKPLEIKRYWELTKMKLDQHLTDEEYLTMLRKQLNESILCRIRDKKTIGCQLSGGMDSSAIAVLLSRLTDANSIHTYSFVLNDKTRTFSERGIDEKATQQLILDYDGLNRSNHHEIEAFHYSSVFEQMKTQIRVMGGYASTDCIWQDTLFKIAAESGVKVSFSGFPGDEGISNPGGMYYFDYIYHLNIFGILTHLRHFRLGGIRQLLNYIRFAISGTYAPDYKAIQKTRDRLNPNSPYAKTLKDDSFKFYPSFKKWMKSQMCRPHTCHRTESEGAYANQYGIETVYPLADIRLLQMVYSLPVRLFRPKPYTRALFRNLCIGILPEMVRLQPKFSGAMTLAFAEYWKKTQAEELKEYILKNHTGLMIEPAEPDKFGEEAESLKGFSLNVKKMDYMIDQHWPESK
jgi:asparagine synthase (glutamine-hydrolysing)